MTRKEFIRMCGLLGVGLPLESSVNSCGAVDKAPATIGKVLIIGAGAAGLSAAYLLNQQGIDFQILEASPNYGGRMKQTTDFADFPIPLGAEWLHVERGVFDEIVNDSSVRVDINTTPYDPNIDYGLFQGTRISLEDLELTVDQKFINSTWYDFFERYIVPSVREKISFDKVVESIDYSGDQVSVRTADQEFRGDKLIFTAPVKILQKGTIAFTPALPVEKLNAISEVVVWDGCKAFIEFTEKFYPAFTAFLITPESDGQKLYYDAAYGQNTDRHILGLFAVGTGTLPYVRLTDDDLIDYMLNELDDIFEGRATPNYVKHIFQNWNAEPHINGAYVNDSEDWRKIRTLGESVGDKLFFAGCTYTTGEDWSSVHTAARSARRAVAELVG